MDNVIPLFRTTDDAKAEFIRRGTASGISGTKSPWQGAIKYAAEADPKFQLGEVVWLEAKDDPDLMRPTFRRRAIVHAIQEELGDCIRYEFCELPAASEWSQRPEPTRSIKA